MNKIKIVQIGVGHDHAPASFSAFAKNPLFDLVGYVVPEGDEAVYEKFRDHYAIRPRLTLEEAFAYPGLSAVDIETTDVNLTYYAQMAADRGLAIQMDKPGGVDDAAYDRLIDTVKRNHCVFHVGYMYRYNPAIRRIFEMQKNGELGEIYSVESQMNCWHPAEKHEWLRQFPGGMMYYLGCHLVDLTVLLQGEPEEICPFNTDTLFHGVSGASDLGMAVFKYKNGASFLKSCASEYGGYMRRNVVVCGTKARVELSPTEYNVGSTGLLKTDMYVLPADAGQDWNQRGEKTTFGPFDRYDDMMTEFGRIILGEQAPVYTPDYEKRIHKLLLKTCGVKGVKE